jgi:hypothetical protein
MHKIITIIFLFAATLNAQNSEINKISYSFQYYFSDQDLTNQYLQDEKKDKKFKVLSEEKLKEEISDYLKFARQFHNGNREVNFIFDSNIIHRKEYSKVFKDAIDLIDLSKSTNTSYYKLGDSNVAKIFINKLFLFDTIYKNLVVKLENFPQDTKLIQGYPCHKQIIKVSYEFLQKRRDQIIELFVTESLNLPASILLEENFNGLEKCALEVKVIDKKMPNSYVLIKAKEINRKLSMDSLALPPEYQNLVFIEPEIEPEILVDSLQNSIDSINAIFSKGPPHNALYGNYAKPKNLLKLKNIIAEKNINIEHLGFFLYDALPGYYGPIDGIPFASTGGDGCHFAFLTDFDFYPDLENTPIIFISPTDFYEDKPIHYVKLIARNFNEFLQVALKLKSFHLLSFKDHKIMDFTKEINGLEKDYLENYYQEELQARENSFKIIMDSFNIKPIDDLNAYFTLIEKERQNENFIPLKDGLGLKSILKESNLDFNCESLESLDSYLKKANILEKMIVMRSYPYFCNYTIRSKAESIILNSITAEQFPRIRAGIDQNKVNIELSRKLTELMDQKRKK